ncbi:MAG: DNA-3-methyladenine glycosylase 2 family protein [Chloroflexi bacterium]|nr:DNA-3-methyladenine glycosylase 2 family protein [Chloroflexota bacterium]
MSEEATKLDFQEQFKLQAEKAMHHLQECDTVIAGLIEQIGPYSITPEQPYFFALLSSIISQQISTKAAAAIQNRFLALFPDSSPAEVTPSRLLTLPKEDLRTAGLSEQKVRYGYDLAEKVEEGVVDLTRIDDLPDEEIIRQLTKVNGIGRWTAEMFLIFSLARPDVLPADDLGFRTAVQRLYGFKERPDPKIVRRFAQVQGWSPYSTAATWYLWRSLNLKDEVVT